MTNSFFIAFNKVRKERKIKMLISKVSGFGFNGKNINPKKVQSTAEKIYSHGANLEKNNYI